MHETLIEETRLSRQLMEFARDTTLRQEVYKRLGEYCHQCRNRLNSLKLSLYLVKRQSHDSLAWQLGWSWNLTIKNSNVGLNASKRSADR